ncbi:hypothetical protein V865_004478 [Kwoniella europaea PYCC6329]|uniref:U1-type domain-containing protein n=1 Tax=Kwoniella europaea PYCC6329 TaxID=1423913 RepID=A0AAX4KJY9_9TREE
MKKRAREDEDGITDLKAAMREMGEDADGSESGSGSEGWSESESDDDDDDEDQDEDEDEDEEQDEDEDNDEDEDGDLDVDIEGLESGSDEEDEDVDEEEDASSSSSSIFPISLESALTDPIYSSPHNPSESLCVLCPDKVLKNDQMTRVHLESKLHKRSLKRYSIRLTTNPPPGDTDPRDLVDEILAEMDSGEVEVEAKAKANEKAMSTGQKEMGKKDSEKKDKKRKRSNKKQRQEEKAKKLISTNSKDTNQQKEGQEEGVKLNRKARRLLALQNGEIQKTQKGEQNQQQK